MTMIPKSQRVRMIVDHLHNTPPASSFIEAYATLFYAIATVEDKVFGPESYVFHATLLGENNDPRMYAPHYESMFKVKGYSKVRIFITTCHITFVSTSGALEIQSKDTADKYGEGTPYKERQGRVLISKPDSQGDSVWHSKNL
jgi:hypothetical protein